MTIGNSVTEIGRCAFYNCSNVKKIVCQNTTPPACGDYALGGISRSSCEVYVPAGSVESYKKSSPWNEFKIVADDGSGTPDEPETCAKPTISIVNGKLYIESSTFGSQCSYTITAEDAKSGVVDKNTLIPLAGQYTISAYAMADGMYNSDKVTATLVWVNPTISGGEDLINMEAKKAVVISSTPNGIRVSGTEHGERISVYSLDGGLICNVAAVDGETFIDCPAGMVIVRIGEKAVKVNVK